MSDAPEFSRPYRLDRIGPGAIAADVTADAGERAALARRFGLIAVDALSAQASLHREDATVIAKGTLTAEVVQACVATGDLVPADIAEPFVIRFVPTDAPEGEEIELDADDCDTIFYSGGSVDLGEAVAETLALALDPYPRSPGAEDALRQAGVLREDEAGPFGALAGLRDRLKGDG